MAKVHGYDHFYIQPEILNEKNAMKLETISEAIEMYPRVIPQEPMLLFNRIRAVTVFFWLTVLIYIMYIPYIYSTEPIVIAIVIVLNVLNLVSLYGVSYKSLPVLGCFAGFELGLWTFSFVYMTYYALFFYPSINAIPFMAWYVVYICGFNFCRAILVMRIYGYILDCYDEIYLSEIITKA